MPGPSSLTLDYDAVLSSTIFNYRKTLEDNIATANAFMFYLMRRQASGYVSTTDIGERMQIPLMYQIGNADSYGGYDTLNVDPIDGITSAFFQWRQASIPVSISGIEELKNEGKARIFNLLKGKIRQAELGIQDYFGQSILRGNGGSAITTPKTSSVNGSLFIDPIPLLVAFDPTSSTVIGNINQSTSTWWRNQFLNSSATTYAGFLKELRKLNNNCSKGTGGMPNLHVVDQNVFELYEAALAAQHRNPSYQKADIPFDNIGFRGKPVVWDEFVPDAAGGSATQSTTSGTWYMLNTKFWQIQYHARRNFVPTAMKTPNNQDARVSHILWLGGAGVSNRRKQGVMGSIDTTITS